MARRWQSGFETNNLIETEHSSVTGSSVSLVSTPVRTGGYALSYAGASASRLRYALVGTLPLSGYIRFAVRLAGTPSAQGIFFSLNSGGAAPLSLAFNTSRQVVALTNEGATTVGTSSIALTVNEWALIEAYCQSHASTGQITVRINGVEAIDGTNLNTGGGTIDYLEFGCGIGGGMGATCYFDDAAFNDTTGSLNNSWPGDGQIIMIAPSSDTATINWTAQNGGSHFAEVDELPGAPDATTYIKSTSATSNLEDRLNLADTPSVIASGATINAICLGIRGGGTSTATRTAQPGLRDDSGNEAPGTNTDWNLNGWKTVYPTLINEQTWGATPVALTKAYLDGLMVYVKDTNTNTNEIRITALWLSIDFTPPAATRPSLPRVSNQAITRTAYW